MNKWNEWMNKKNEWRNYWIWIYEYMNITNYCMDEWMNEWMKEWINEGIYKGTEWMNK